jgi:hypothetical protein
MEIPNTLMKALAFIAAKSPSRDLSNILLILAGDEPLPLYKKGESYVVTIRKDMVPASHEVVFIGKNKSEYSIYVRVICCKNSDPMRAEELVPFMIGDYILHAPVNTYEPIATIEPIVALVPLEPQNLPI